MNCKIKYRYYCNTEAAWITEILDDTAAAPTQCKNDPAHTFNANSLSSNGDTICTMIPYSGICESDLSSKSTSTVTLEELAKHVLYLIICLQKKKILL